EAMAYPSELRLLDDRRARDDDDREPDERRDPARVPVLRDQTLLLFRVRELVDDPADDEHGDQDERCDPGRSLPRRRPAEREESAPVEPERDEEEDAQDQAVLDQPEDARAPPIGDVVR